MAALFLHMRGIELFFERVFFDVVPSRSPSLIIVNGGSHPERARHRYRQSQFAGLTRLQLDEVGRERQVQQQGRQRAEALAERSVEIAQAMVPLAGALARGGG